MDELLEENAAPKNKKKKCSCLHKNETLVQETENGYLFVRNGEGTVYFRSHKDHQNFIDENEKHAEEVRYQEPRIPVRSAY